jgi:trimeric autotransporter adhesin
VSTGVRSFTLAYLFAAVALAQALSSLQLSSATATSGATVPLYLSLTSSPTNPPVMVQWDLNTPSTVVSTNTTVGGVAASAGLYSAPTTVATQQTFTAIATSAADPTKSASSTITLLAPVSVAVNPAKAILLASMTQQLTAAVTGGDGNTGVVRSLSPNVGTISSSSIYRVPASVTTNLAVTVAATSVADPSISSDSILTLVAQVVTATPTTLGALQIRQFRAIVDGAITARVRWSISPPIGTITPGGIYIAPSIILLIAASTSDPTKTASTVITLSPAAITPATIEVGRGESIQFAVTFDAPHNSKAASTIQPGFGSISPTTGLYFAPWDIPSSEEVTVTATSVSDPTKIATATVTLAPCVVKPCNVILGAAQAHQFIANLNGANQSVTWSIAPSPGAISEAGLYLAPNNISSDQVVIVTATTAGGPNSFAQAVILLLPTTIPQGDVDLMPSRIRQFTVLDAYGMSVPATWLLIPRVGSISATGLYVAPLALASNRTLAVVATPISTVAQPIVAHVTLSPSAAQLSQFDCLPDLSTTTCTVRLSAPARWTGVDVALTSNPTGAVSAPPSWHIAAGATTASFPVTVLSDGVRLTATLGTSIAVSS